MCHERAFAFQIYCEGRRHKDVHPFHKTSPSDVKKTHFNKSIMKKGIIIKFSPVACGRLKEFVDHRILHRTWWTMVMMMADDDNDDDNTYSSHYIPSSSYLSWCIGDCDKTPANVLKCSKGELRRVCTYGYYATACYHTATDFNDFENNWAHFWLSAIDDYCLYVEAVGSEVQMMIMLMMVVGRWRQR